MNLVRCLSFPVICVLVLVAFVYYTVVMLVIEPWLSLSTGTGLFNGLAFTLMTIMALICYGLAILRDPGRVPTSYIPDLEDSQNCLQEIKRKGGDLRYCQKCKHYKPPRAHHCRVCKRCVLRMDHHCVWINNCVGHSNYKAFFLFVFYIVGASIHALTLLGFHAVEEFGRLQQGSEDKFMRVQPASTIDAVSSLLKILCGTILLPLFVALSVLLTWHVYLLFQNKTTIEYHEGIRARWLAESAGQLFQHPYDLGPFSNLIMVLGPDAICWFCPSAVSHIGTGLQFPTFSDHGEMGNNWKFLLKVIHSLSCHDSGYIALEMVIVGVARKFANLNATCFPCSYYMHDTNPQIQECASEEACQGFLRLALHWSMVYSSPWLYEAMSKMFAVQILSMFTSFYLLHA